MAAAEFTQFVTTNLLVPTPVRNTLIAQGISDCDDFLEYSDYDIQNLTKRMIQPGGTLPGRGNQPPRANRGINVTFVQEQNLRKACFYRKYMHRIQRDFNAAGATLPIVKEVWADRFELENPSKDGFKEEIKDPVPLTKVEDVRKMIETLDHVLNKRLGVGGSPLSYVTRVTVALPEHTPGEVDPGFGMPSRSEELIRRTRHTGPDYTKDNKAVWAIIRGITHGGPGWGWVSRFSRHEQGREAYNAVKTHYFGESFITRTVTKADATIETLFYDGKSRNYSFEKFCEQLNKAYADLDENGEPLTEAKKVRRLLSAVRDPRLEAAKNTIMVTTHLRSNLTGAMSHFADTLDLVKQLPKSRSIAAAATNNAGRGRGGRGRGGRGRGGRSGRGGRGGRGRGQSNTTSAFDPSNPGKSYSPSEWRTLSVDEMAKCRAARANNPRPRTAGAVTTEAETTAAAETTRSGPGITRPRG